MIECENCILEKAVHVCEVDCLALENALREHDKQIRTEVISQLISKLEVNMPSELDEKERYGYTVALTSVLEQLKEQNK